MYGFTIGLDEKMKKSILLKRAAALIDQDDTVTAEKDVDEFLELFPNSSEAFYYKGIISK